MMTAITIKMGDDDNPLYYDKDDYSHFFTPFKVKCFLYVEEKEMHEEVGGIHGTLIHNSLMCNEHVAPLFPMDSESQELLELWEALYDEENRNYLREGLTLMTHHDVLFITDFSFTDEKISPVTVAEFIYSITCRIGEGCSLVVVPLYTDPPIKYKDTIKKLVDSVKCLGFNLSANLGSNDYWTFNLDNLMKLVDVSDILETN